jgi:hypothetical protein
MANRYIHLIVRYLFFSLGVILFDNVAAREGLGVWNTTEVPITGTLDCMDILDRCCQDVDCSLLNQLNHLFQCIEALRRPPGQPPYCTDYCRGLISQILQTEYGAYLESCNCSRVEETNVPKISFLCQPFQSHARTNCGVITPTPSVPVTTKAPTTESVTTKTPTTEFATTKAPTTN